MRIIVHLADDEAYRKIEDEEENIREAYLEVVRRIEDTMCMHQIGYVDIEIADDPR